MKTGPWLPGNRQQLPETPHVACASFDRITRNSAADGGVVVLDFERSEALIADPQRFGGKPRPAQMALEPGHKRHASPSRCTFTVLTVHATRSRRYVSLRMRSAAAVRPVVKAAMDGPAPLRQKPITSGCRTRSTRCKPGTSRSRYG